MNRSESVPKKAPEKDLFNEQQLKKFTRGDQYSTYNLVFLSYSTPNCLFFLLSPIAFLSSSYLDSPPQLAFSIFHTYLDCTSVHSPTQPCTDNLMLGIFKNFASFSSKYFIQMNSSPMWTPYRKIKS